MVHPLPRQVNCCLAFVLLFCCCTHRIHAQTVHAVVVADVSPSAQWGAFQLSVQMDGAILRSALARNLPEGQLNLQNFIIEEDQYGTPTAVSELIAELPVKANDTIFFYYSGHGGNDDRGHYLALPQGRLYRSELRQLLENKGARLVVLITDCCNQRSDGQAFGAPYMDMEPPTKVSPLFESLFLLPKGTVDINSSSPGEAAYFFPFGSETELAPSSIFTGEFVSFLDRFSDRQLTWGQLVQVVSLNVHLAFRAAYPKGASVAKGQSVQRDQNVYVSDYPGMPPSEGPRTGFSIREQEGKGVIITQVRAGYPAARVFDISTRRYRSLAIGEKIVGCNGELIETVAQLLEAVRKSPQIMRLTISGEDSREHDVLLRLRY